VGASGLAAVATATTFRSAGAIIATPLTQSTLDAAACAPNTTTDPEHMRVLK